VQAYVDQVKERIQGLIQEGISRGAAA
jgi:hypothetical protein